MRRGLRVAWFLYLAALLITAAGVLYLLWGRLAAYQADIDAEKARTSAQKLEEQAPQIAFEEYMRTKGAIWWSEQFMEARKRDSSILLDTPKQVREYFEQLLSVNEVHYFKEDTWQPEHPVYRARIGDTSIYADVFLTGAGLSWEVTDVDIRAVGTCGGEIEAPDGASVFCGRTKLTEEYRLPDEISHFPFSEYETALVNPVHWYIWQVSGLLCEPMLQVSGSGVWSAQDGCTIIRLSGEDAATLMERTDAFLRAYLNYVMSGKSSTDAHLSECLSLVKNGSTAHKILTESRSSTAASMSYSNLEIELVSADKPIRWADNCSSADIVYHAYARLGGERKDYSVEDQRLRVLFLDQGAGWEICAFQIL